MKQSHTRAFFIQGALLTLALLLSLSVLVQAYGRAREIAADAAHKTVAALILQEAQAELAAGAEGYTEPGRCTYTYDAEARRQDADGAYCLTADITAEPTAAGTMLQAVLTVEYKGQTVAQLTTAHYRPGRAAA